MQQKTLFGLLTFLFPSSSMLQWREINKAYYLFHKTNQYPICFRPLRVYFSLICLLYSSCYC